LAYPESVPFISVLLRLTVLPNQRNLSFYESGSTAKGTPVFKDDNHTQEVWLYLSKEQYEKAFELSRYEKRLKMVRALGGISVLPLISALFKAFHG